MKTPEKKSILAMIEFRERTIHKFFTDIRKEALKQADIWLAQQMKENPNESCRLTFSEVVHSIEF